MNNLHIPKHMIFDGTIPLEVSHVALDKLEAAESALSPWKQARLGKITGSCFNRVTRDRTGKGWSESAKSYMAELIFEWITGDEASSFSGSDATLWGEAYETEALRKYQDKTGNKVKRGKFYLAKGFNGLIGCTPDGIGKTRGLEIKCPYGPKAHTYTLLSQKIPTEYLPQVYGHMLCANRDFCDFVSYDPRMFKRPDLALIVIEVEKDKLYMDNLKDRLYEFEEELIKNLDRLEIDWRSKVKA